MRREHLRVVGTDELGPYRLLRLARGSLEIGTPGQFFMLEAPGRPLPRPFSLCLAPRGELAFLVDPIGPGTRAIAAAQTGEKLAVLGPLGNGFDLDVRRPLLVGGGIGVAPFPFLSEQLRHAARDPRVPDRGARCRRRAGAERGGRTRTDGSSPKRFRMILATSWRVGLSRCSRPCVRSRPSAQLAWEAPMACGYGACYGCVVSFDGHYRRLCIEGPVLRFQKAQAAG